MSKRIVTKETAAIAASMMSGLGMLLHSATKRKTKRSESGAERAAKRLAAEKKDTAKRLKNVVAAEAPTRQQIRAQCRRLGLPSKAWRAFAQENGLIVGEGAF